MMHSIKHQARNVAWRPGGNDGEVNYNPFAKRSRSYVRNRSPGDDLEAGLRKHNTADQAQLAAEQGRYLEMNGVENGDYAQPHHVSTDPVISNSTPFTTGAPSNPLTTSGNPAPILSPVDEKQSDRTVRGSSDDMTSQSILKPQQTQNESNGKPRKRLRLLGILGQPDRTGSSSEHVADVARTDTEDTEEDGKKKKFRRKISPWFQFKAVMFGSWVNVLLICVPVGFAVRYAHLNGIAIFVINFIAIIPLAALLSFATEELAMYTGETLGGLLNASFGNATELIVGVIALAQNKILIVQTSLIGSMLSNLLLVLGMCFFFGGWSRVTQHFNVTVAQTASSMLALSIGSLIIPTAFDIFGTGDSHIGEISHGTAIILLFVYISYLYFQLSTHSDIYNAPSEKSAKTRGGKRAKGDTIRGLATMGAGSAAASGGQIHQSNLVQDPDDEAEQPSLTVVGALVTLTIATVLIAFTSEFMVSGIDYIVDVGHISEEFVGLILVPIVGNAAEHATAVTVAVKDKMDLAIGVAVGSSMQIALLVLPLCVMLSWFGVGDGGMNLDFDGFQVAVLFIAVLLVNYLIQDGESHWLEGMLLMCLYIIIALTSWWYPATGVA